MTRETTLDTAKQMVCGHREQDYGTPEDNFLRIANLWTAYLQGVGSFSPVTATDVAIMMALMKIARLESNPKHEDSWVDAAGYIACGAEIATEVINA